MFYSRAFEFVPNFLWLELEKIEYSELEKVLLIIILKKEDKSKFELGRFSFMVDPSVDFKLNFYCSDARLLDLLKINFGKSFYVILHFTCGLLWVETESAVLLFFCSFSPILAMSWLLSFFVVELTIKFSCAKAFCTVVIIWIGSAKIGTIDDWLIMSVWGCCSSGWNY